MPTLFGCCLGRSDPDDAALGAAAGPAAQSEMRPAPFGSYSAAASPTSASATNFSPSLMLATMPRQPNAASVSGSPTSPSAGMAGLSLGRGAGRSPLQETCSQALLQLEHALVKIDQALAAAAGDVAVSNSSGGGVSPSTSLARRRSSTADRNRRTLWSSLRAAIKGDAASGQKETIERLALHTRTALLMLETFLSAVRELVDAQNAPYATLADLAQAVCGQASEVRALFRLVDGPSRASIEQFASKRIREVLTLSITWVMQVKQYFQRPPPNIEAFNVLLEASGALKRALLDVSNTASELYYHIDLPFDEIFYMLARDVEKKIVRFTDMPADEAAACQNRYMAFGNQIHFAGRQVTKILKDMMLAGPTDPTFLEISKRLAFSCCEIIDYTRRATRATEDEEFQRDLQANVEEMMLAAIVLFNTVAVMPVGRSRSVPESSESVAGSNAETERAGAIDATDEKGAWSLHVRVEKNIRIVFVACANLMRRAKQGMSSLVACEGNITLFGDMLSIVDADLLIAQSGQLMPREGETDDFGRFMQLTRPMLGNLSSLTSSIGEQISGDAETRQQTLTNTINEVCHVATQLQEAVCTAARALTSKFKDYQVSLLQALKKLLESYSNFMKSTYSVIRRIGVTSQPSKSFSGWISQQFGLLSHLSSQMDVIRREAGPFPSDFAGPARAGGASGLRAEWSLAHAEALAGIPPILDGMLARVTAVNLASVVADDVPALTLLQRRQQQRSKQTTYLPHHDTLIKRLDQVPPARAAQLTPPLEALLGAYQTCHPLWEQVRAGAQSYHQTTLIQSLETKLESVLAKAAEKVQDFSYSLQKHVDRRAENRDAAADEDGDVAFVIQLLTQIKHDLEAVIAKLRQVIASAEAAPEERAPVPDGPLKEASGSPTAVPSPLLSVAAAAPAIAVSAASSSALASNPSSIPASATPTTSASAIQSEDDRVLASLAQALEREVVKLNGSLQISVSGSQAVLNASGADKPTATIRKDKRTLRGGSAQAVAAYLGLPGQLPKNSEQSQLVSDMVNTDSFHKQLQNSTRAIAAASLAIFQAATRAQRELSAATEPPHAGERGQLVSIAMELAARVSHLAGNVNDYVQANPRITIEVLRAATRAILPHCVQMQTAVATKSAHISPENVQLCKESSRNVTLVVERMLKVIDDATKELDVDEGGEDMRELIAVMNKRGANNAAVTAEIEAQAEIIKMESELQKARSRLVDLRRKGPVKDARA